MEDEFDRTLESLKVQIKKEIIDHYFAERVFLEEEIQVLQAGVGEYQQGVTQASRRFRNLILDLYGEVEQHLRDLQGKYRKITLHLELINEDIAKFNASFDFGLIAAPMEALDGGGGGISGGLL